MTSDAIAVMMPAHDGGVVSAKKYRGGIGLVQTEMWNKQRDGDERHGKANPRNVPWAKRRENSERDG
jgi:hypothetical protein